MFQYIPRHDTDTLRSHHNLLPVNIPDHLICDFLIRIHRLNIVYSKWKDIFIVDSIHNCVAVKLISKGLSCSKELRILCSARIYGENRCSCKSEQMVFLKVLYNSRVHISELAAVTFIKNNDDVLHIHFMPRILFYKSSQFLYCSNNNMRILVFQLTF